MFSKPGSSDAVTLGAQGVLAEAEAVARKRQHGIDVAGELRAGAAAAVLRGEAGNAAEIVIGGRGRFRAGDASREYAARRLRVATAGPRAAS
ncbi:hypothetical protein [Nonomuraea fuscirosea]|uniref:hypothetical protein n=1 Tax=Nonomuraea fuscirosea TaxID=1291556 RepID=UPI0015E7B059|nr:hypothetical protein [Nonomuraea fuscirosea]